LFSPEFEEPDMNDMMATGYRVTVHVCRNCFLCTTCQISWFQN